MSIHGIVKHKFLKDLVTLKKGKKAQNVYIKQLPETVPYILIESFNHNIAAYTDATDMVLCKPEDILIVWDGARAGLSTSGHSGAIGSTIAKLEIKNKNEVYPKYLYQFISSKYERLNQNTHGAAIPHLNKYYLEGLEIPLPPLPTQHRIASILETCESAIQKRKEANRLTDEFLKSTFLEMFGDPATNPKKWKSLKLGSLVDIDRNSITPEEIVQDTKYVGLEHIESESGAIINYIVTTQNQIKSNKFKFTVNSILLGKLRPYLNKVAMPNFDGICSTDILPLYAKRNLADRYFITYLLRHKGYVTYATERSTGANLPRISPNAVEEFETYSPPFDLQQKFADIVQKVEKLKQKQHESEKELTNLFNSLMQRAFRGEL